MVKEFFLDPPDKVAWVCGDASKVREALEGYSWTSLRLPLKILDSTLRGIAQFLQQDDGAISAGLTNFSAVLVGTVMAALYPVFFNGPLTVEIWLYMIVAAVFSVCVGTGLGVITGKHNLPGFTLPFNIATSITFLCLRARGFGNPVQHAEVVNNTSSDDLGHVTVDDSIDWSQVWMGTMLSAGQVYAVESVTCSVLTLAGLLLCSPILTVASYIGALLATFTALAVSSPPYSLVYAGVWGYNGFLSAGCLAFFMVPTPKIMILAAINAIFTTFLQAAIIPVFAANQLPVFTFPFCLSSLLFLALSTSAGMGSKRMGNPTYPEYHLALHYEPSGSTENGTNPPPKNSTSGASLPATTDNNETYPLEQTA